MACGAGWCLLFGFLKKTIDMFVLFCRISGVLPRCSSIWRVGMAIELPSLPAFFISNHSSFDAFGNYIQWSSACWIKRLVQTNSAAPQKFLRKLPHVCFICAATLKARLSNLLVYSALWSAAGASKSCYDDNLAWHLFNSRLDEENKKLRSTLQLKQQMRQTFTDCKADVRRPSPG